MATTQPADESPAATVIATWENFARQRAELCLADVIDGELLVRDGNAAEGQLRFRLALGTCAMLELSLAMLVKGDSSWADVATALRRSLTIQSEALEQTLDDIRRGRHLRKTPERKIVEMARKLVAPMAAADQAAFAAVRALARLRGGDDSRLRSVEDYGRELLEARILQAEAAVAGSAS